MLVVDRDSRISAEDLEKKMKGLYENCAYTEDYCVRKHQNSERNAPKPELHRRGFGTDVPTKNGEPSKKDKVPKVPRSDFR
ncbi:hypothetical protein HD806DRAFT_500629 [Xylariaceae sp. AK1471]|nr:hypothetical protein HD806DRAFT_500629 [Xylariaceae sp. AK1471]